VSYHEERFIRNGWTRRKFLLSTLGAAIFTVSDTTLLSKRNKREWSAKTFISKVSRYGAEIASVIISGLNELGVVPEEIRGKKILLKPNLVEAHMGADHINTHPLVIRGAVEAFLRLGAAQVLVAEGTGLSRDSLRLLEESGWGEVLIEDRIPFVDLNYDDVYTVRNLGRQSRLKTLTFPVTLRQADWIVSMPKLKTHHWAGVTLSMKNLFGVMPGMFYGWPKNVLHWAGIERSILDINATLCPHFAIVDGIVGMEGDGPIMGTPRHVGILVMGRNFVAVDATCTRIMGLNPQKVNYLAAASNWLGPVGQEKITQCGETIESVRTNFALIEKIPAHKKLRL
jgi:uncharacterized protein (DUF362 family)